MLKNCTTVTGTLKATIYIILQGKELDFISLPHVVGAFNSMFSASPFLRSCVLYESDPFEAYMRASNYGKRKGSNYI